MVNQIPVAVLGATGAVGQRFISLLADHPWFEVAALTGSERSAGQRYAEAVNWVVPGEIPQAVRDLVIQPALNTAPSDGVRVAFSALHSEVAREVEPVLAAQGYCIFSNASALRMEPDVPLLIPDINPDHVALIDAQRARRGWPGFVVTVPNCTTSGLVFPLRALHDAFGVELVHAVSMQALSGAGYPGVASLDIVDNVIPYIKGEEDKVETEPRKLLGRLADGAIQMAEFTISAQTNRVAVIDGHTIACSVRLAGSPRLDDVKAALAEWQAPPPVRDLPSTPERSIILREEPDRPQPRRDRDAGRGMTVSVGRVQPCPVLGFKLIVLAHNTIRGAAGGAIHNAEWAYQSGYLAQPAPQTAEAAQGS